MGSHTEDADDVSFLIDRVDEAILNVNATRIIPL